MSHEGPDHVYAFDASTAPDTEFEPGALTHLVPGNTGRLLDPRRTPVTVTAIDSAAGMFAVEVTAFEDAGATWHVPLEEVGRFQFSRHAARARDADVALYTDAIAMLDRPLTIPVDPAAAARTRARIADARPQVRARLRALGLPAQLDPGPAIQCRQGDPELAALVQSLLAEHGLAEMDEAFAAAFVSNPWSGELVKGHAIVAAELGLAAYEGKGVRDTRLFDEPWSKPLRAEHLVLRAAMTAELWRVTGVEEVTLYRAGGTEDRVVAQRPPVSFTSATFSRAVADAHFADDGAPRAAFMFRQRVPVEQLFMTFWETSAMNRVYAEAEALLFGSVFPY